MIYQSKLGLLTLGHGRAPGPINVPNYNNRHILRSTNQSLIFSLLVTGVPLLPSTSASVIWLSEKYSSCPFCRIGEALQPFNAPNRRASQLKRCRMRAKQE